MSEGFLFNNFAVKMEMTPEHMRLHQEIDEILWNDWDPIGVNDIAPRDEYKSYTSVIFSLKITDANQDEIAHKLHEIAWVKMGISDNMEHCLKVAQKIMAL